MRRNVPIAIAATVGLFFIAAYYLPFLDAPSRLIEVWSPVIFGFAFFLGILSFWMHHSAKIRKRTQGWGYNVLAMGSFLVMAIVGLLPELWPDAFDFLGARSKPAEESVFMWLFAYALVPMEATMFALLAFFIASAAFRAFRARNLEATLMLIAAALIMIGRVPLGEAVWGGFTDIQQWIMDYPNTAAKRAIMIGVGLGMTSTALKLILGIERAYLGSGK